MLIDRGDHESAMHSMKEVQQSLMALPRTMLVFPEGSRSKVPHFPTLSCLILPSSLPSCSKVPHSLTLSFLTPFPHPCPPAARCIIPFPLPPHGPLCPSPVAGPKVQ